jgi:hypothetical protein
MPKPKVQTPGDNLPPEDDIDTEGDTGDGQPTGGDEGTAALKAHIEALQRENSLLRAASEAKTPRVLYEPETPHGKAEIAASKHRHLTAAQFAATIDAGEAAEPPVNGKVLCADGWYVSRRPEPVK